MTGQGKSYLVIGSRGQVATELRARLPQARFLDRASLDLAQSAACATTIRQARPGIVLNAAAYTAVDRAEEDPDLAFAVNADAPASMAQACAELGIPLVHISTDYVFDGRGDTPHAPHAPTCPIGVYGASKCAGEERIRESGVAHVILRTSWVFSAHGQNFVKTMLRYGAERDTMKIVADQIGGPTPARAIAAALCSICDHILSDPSVEGTYHFSGAPDTNWADFARAVFEVARLTTGVEDIPTSAYPTAAARPLNSRLDCTSTQQVFGIERPDWRAGLVDVIGALKDSTKGQRSD